MASSQCHISMWYAATQELPVTIDRRACLGKVVVRGGLQSEQHEHVFRSNTGHARRDRRACLGEAVVQGGLQPAAGQGPGGVLPTAARRQHRPQVPRQRPIHRRLATGGFADHQGLPQSQLKRIHQQHRHQVSRQRAVHSRLAAKVLQITRILAATIATVHSPGNSKCFPARTCYRFV